MQIALLAAVAAFFQNIVAVAMTQAEARNRAHLGAVSEVVMYLLGVWTTNWALKDLNSHNLGIQLAVMGFVSIANYWGSYTGTRLGQRFIKSAPENV